MKFGIKILVTHVAGTRMQVQGTDGVSRGNMRTGVTAGKDMIEFCPWAKSPLEVSPSLKSWVESWSGEQSIFLSPKDWFIRGHDKDFGTQPHRPVLMYGALHQQLQMHVLKN